MTTSRTIDAHLRRANRVGNPNAVRVVVFDGEHALCLSEPMLDTWWSNLAPVIKAEIYELALGDEAERCIHCGCTQNRACEGGCSWLDANHTVCSAEPCAAKHIASLRASLLDTRPVSEYPEATATACGSSLDFMKRHTSLVHEMIAAGSRLIEERRSVDATV